MLDRIFTRVFLRHCAGSLVFAALLLAGCGNFFTPITSTATTATPKFAYVANFQNATAGSISAFTLNSTTGALTQVGSAVATGPNSTSFGPASLVTVLGKYLYSANDGGTVTAFSINTTTGAITIIGAPFTTGGNNPNSLAADAAGKFLYVANFGSNTISVFSIDAATGSLTAVGTPVVTGSSAGTAGPPVALAIHPTGKFLYAALDSNGIALFTLNATTGVPAFVSTIAPPAGAQPQSVAVEKTGKFLYAADGVNAVDEYSIDTTTGALTALATPNSSVAAGTVPIVLTADASGSHIYVANRDSNNAHSYGILTTGALSAIGTATATGSSPSGIGVDPSGKFVYVTNFSGSPDVSIFTIDSSGKLANAGAATSTATSGAANAAAIAFL
ncbi:MAG: 6-phosphogluconolactonase, cycloisomerase 2 family [Acidobacteriales bacterium]|nr:6-phosphogluconolactonase, cycloisomerase 2 family [Terriglobales bacterium]